MTHLFARSSFARTAAIMAGLVLVAAAAVANRDRPDPQPGSGDEVGLQVTAAKANSSNAGGGSAPSPPANPPNGNTPPNGNAFGPNKKFAVTGDVSDLYPEIPKPIALELTNPHAFAIKVTSLTVTVTGTDKTGCGKQALITTDWAGELTIPGKGSITTAMPNTVQVELQDPPDACQGAAFTLSYGGKAVKL